MRDARSWPCRTITMAGALICAMTLACTCTMLSGCSQSTTGNTSAAPAQSAAEHAYTDTIAKGAISAHLLLQTDMPLAADVAADSVTLDGAFAGFNISEMERVDDTTLGLIVEAPAKTKAPKDAYAYVMLDETAFAVPHASASAADASSSSDSEASADAEPSESGESAIGQVIALRVSGPMATILPLEGGYDPQAGTFLLPISLGYAEFARTPEAADFTLADTSLSISGVDYDGSSLTKATLRIDAAAYPSAREAFDTLDDTLTKNGITVAADATNCGKVCIGSDEMRAAERDGYEVTALACLAANPSAYIENTYAIESKTQDDDGQTDYDVHLQTRIDATPGTCALPDKNIGEAVEVDHLTGIDEEQILGEDVIRIDEHQLFLNVYMPSKIVDSLAYADGEDVLEEAQHSIARISQSHKLVLAEGVLSNAWGIAEPATEVDIYLVKDLSTNEETEEASAAAIELVQKAYAADGDDASSDAGTSFGNSSDSQSSSSGSNGNNNIGDSDEPNRSGQADDPDDPDDSDQSGSSDDPDDPDDSDQSGSSDDPDNSNASDSSQSAKDIDPEEERSSYADSDATVINQDDNSTNSTDDANASYGSVDYNAYNLANDDEDLKKAREAFEIMSQVMETAGAFARGAEGDPSGWIEGAGGVFGFVSQMLGLGEEEPVKLEDIMDKLDEMDGEIRTIDAKVDELSHQLKEVEDRLHYDIDLGNLRDAVTKNEYFGKPLREHLWSDSATKWDYDKSKGFDGMSDEQKEEIRKFLDEVDGLETQFNYTAADKTLQLGAFIIGDKSLAAKSIVEEFDDCLDTWYNWEPETYIYRIAFRLRLEYAYLCGYTTAVTQVQYLANKSGDSDKYKVVLQTLAENYHAVQDAMQGKVTYEDVKGDSKTKEVKVVKIEESNFAAATHDNGDGKIKNLVTGSRFGLGSGRLMVRPDEAGDFCNYCSEPDQVSTWKFNGSINRGDLDKMVERLGHTKYKSLWDEIVAMTSDRGFVWSEDAAPIVGVNYQTYWTHKGTLSTETISATHIYDRGINDPAKYLSRILVSKASRHCLHDQPSKRHTYHWTADYYDLIDNSLHPGTEVYLADQKYLAGSFHWDIQISIRYFYTLQKL